MAKWPIVRVTEAGNKVFRITCAESGVEFEHEQVGRGRPPVYAPEVRARRSTEKPERPEGAARRGRPPAVLRVEVSDETPEPGDIVMRLGTNIKNRENALKWVTPAKLISVDGETATVERKGETLTTKFANLVKLNLG